MMNDLPGDLIEIGDVVVFIGRNRDRGGT